MAEENPPQAEQFALALAAPKYDVESVAGLRCFVEKGRLDRLDCLSEGAKLGHRGSSGTEAPQDFSGGRPGGLSRHHSRRAFLTLSHDCHSSCVQVQAAHDGGAAGVGGGADVRGRGAVAGEGRHSVQRAGGAGAAAEQCFRMISA